MKGSAGYNINTMAFLLIAMFAMGGTAAFAQKPTITSVDVKAAGAEDIVTLQGHTFGNDATQLDVFFGASKGTLKFVSDQLVEVAVPPGATYDKISVSNKSSGLTGYTHDNFLPSYGGEHGFGATNLQGQKDFDSESGLYDLCMCDFDGDNKNDIATANDNSSSMTVQRNTSTAPNLAGITFSNHSIFLNAKTVHAACGDLNGDGKPDLVVTEAGAIGDRVYIMQNKSNGPGNINFTTPFVKLTGKKLKRVKIADLDLDGRPEILVTNQSGNNITILANNSTPASISFASSPITVAVTGATSSDGLSVDDLNGDGYPEVITSQFLTANSNIFILENNSTSGAISLGNITALSLGGTIVNVKVGDLDGDGKADIAATQLLGASVSIFLNQSSSGSIAFSSSPTPFATEDRPWGIDFGDLDGDGKTDIAIASLTHKSLTILNNESTPGNLAFQRSTKVTTYINRHITIGDVDGDGKPDIAFTSIDDNNNGIAASKISIFRNSACMKPEIDPAGPHNICAGFPLQLTASVSAGTTYEWKDNTTTTVATGADAFYDVTEPSGTHSYTVTAIAEGGACSLTSNAVEVTVNPGTTSGTAIPTNNGPICEGSTLNLSVNDVGGTEYKWTGPEGYTGTGLTPTPIANFQQENAGRYYLDVIVGSCVAQQVSTVVDAVAVPDFVINTGGSPVVCAPDTKTLSIAPAPTTFTYQWYETNTGIIADETTTTFNAPASGSYYVEAKYTANPACATVQTDPVEITFATSPTSAFNVQATACRGENVTFTNQSSHDTSLTPVYLWEFGDGETSSDKDPVHKYTSAASFTVKLSVSYDGGACNSTVTRNIDIQNAPVATISNPDNMFSLCAGDSLELTVAGPFTSYNWSTGETTPSIFLRTGGLVSVDVSTAAGCTINATTDITLLDAPEVTIIADPAEIGEGETTQLTANGLNNYTWDADETLSDVSISNPVASPLVTTSYRVSGSGENGCQGEAVIEIVVRAGSVYSKITPSKFFSPDNGDEFGKFWLVENIEDYPYCEVAIYDEKGVQVHSAKPYQNDWNGTFKGQPLPDGVYYFVIKCEGEQNSPKTGSITILR